MRRRTRSSPTITTTRATRKKPPPTGASATYHALQLPPNGIKFFKLLDHSAIYLLIAGTHAAISRLLPRTGFQRALLAGVWMVAVIGIGSEWLLPAPPYSLTVSVYVF